MNSILNPARLGAAALAAVIALSLAACATPAVPGGPPLIGDTPHPESIVVGAGSVLQVDDSPAELCFYLLQSYPPQCSGIELIGWDWNTVEGSETASGVTWGSYAVWGTYDGETLTVTDSVLLALYDPLFEEHPKRLPENAGTTSESDLLTIQQQLHTDPPFDIVSSSPGNGYLFVTVYYDDGTYQEWADNRFGPDVIVIENALRPVDGP
ncbi:MAG TPA: hypothetical protein PK781_07005 [Terrimesophilobacter sp.]|nr:hypothetical protein [Terrimesophilobacter sp.]